MRAKFLSIAVLAASSLAAQAQDALLAREQLYGQVLAHPLVFGVEPAFHAERADGFYLMEWVPEGQSVEDWQQMQTITAHRAVGSNHGDDQAASLGENIAVNFLNGYRDNCATEVDALPLPITGAHGARAAFAAYMGCSQVRGTDHAEEMVILVMVGATDSYTLQWAERSPARAAFDREDFSRWRPRIEALTQAHLCTVPDGEEPPYPSCN
ncbi:hypothetical protein [Pararhodobacter zhoushanensis]|uniref:hypothetical protein n=1 Tax=Pararhodobacter zhoushanensis TaxID=2479545 RepID=UPI000F8C97A3|nr:hypothetical protein [Pararhodobacter zhoushanensis]